MVDDGWHGVGGIPDPAACIPFPMLYAQFDESNSDCEEKQRAPKRRVYNNPTYPVTLDTGTPGPDSASVDTDV